MIILKENPLVAAGLVALVIVSGAFVHFTSLSNRWDRLDSLAHETEALKDAANQGDALAQQVAELQERVHRQDAALPATLEIGSLLEQLGTDLRALEVRDRSLTTGSPSQFGDLDQVRLELAFTGSFEAAFDLLDRVHGYERVVRVEQLQISRSPRASLDQLAISARLVTFASNGEAR
ncbi:MAG: type 4a pilus biogenesis protein PilO [Phycisphaeraceae bacterium]